MTTIATTRRPKAGDRVDFFGAEDDAGCVGVRRGIVRRVYVVGETEFVDISVIPRADQPVQLRQRVMSGPEWRRRSLSNYSWAADQVPYWEWPA